MDPQQAIDHLSSFPDQYSRNHVLDLCFFGVDIRDYAEGKPAKRTVLSKKLCKIG